VVQLRPRIGDKRALVLVALYLAIAVVLTTPTAGLAQTISGPDDFRVQVEAGMDALATIGLRSYVSSQIGTIDTLMPVDCQQGGVACLAYTDRPSAPYARATTHLRWPQTAWSSAPNAAAYLAHEATHVARFRVAPLDWADERAPVAVENAVRWALLTLQTN
jgi:hypothetical protein